ncbi:HtaA domain-containing protein, partial [Conexibacter stalactiti]
PATPGAPAAPPAQPAPPAPSQPEQPAPEEPIVAIGTTDWGFRASFRSYVFNGNGRPPISVAAGATCDTDPPSTKGGCPADVPFAFSAVAGDYDPATGAGVVEHRGTVTFDYPGHFFRLALRDPTFTITSTTVTVNARVTLDSTLAGTPSADGRVDLGSFPLDGAPVVAGRRLTLRTAAGELSTAAAGLLGSFLQAGAELDPITLSADVVD